MVDEKKYVCSECGFEQDSMDRRCDKCGSVRVVSISVIKNLFGENWKKCFDTPGGDK